jgi:hypothetical protein
VNLRKPLQQPVKSITFTNVGGTATEYAPKPATQFLPEWYKATATYIGDGKNPSSTSTIKKCIPVFDAITAGYVLITPFDVYVEQVNGEPEYRTMMNNNGIQFHPVMQGSKHPKSMDMRYPKWINPWGIQTPTGYSILFTPPMHNPNPWFTVLQGVVDTDEYTAPVNFPFVLNDPKFEGMIPAGTPMVQVIPFKRDSWQMEMGDAKNIEQQNKVTAFLNSQFFDRYKRMYWTRKEFR